MVFERAAGQGVGPAGIYLPIQGVRSAEDKTIRVSALQPDVKNGYLRFGPDQRLLIEQLAQFPLGAHDDGPDAGGGGWPWPGSRAAP